MEGLSPLKSSRCASNNRIMLEARLMSCIGSGLRICVVASVSVSKGCDVSMFEVDKQASLEEYNILASNTAVFLTRRKDVV